MHKKLLASCHCHPASASSIQYPVDIMPHAHGTSCTWHMAHGHQASGGFRFSEISNKLELP
jgi:hypothetical protein